MIEIELIEECRKGNLSNFRKVIEKTSPYVYSVAFRIVGDEDLARDIVQDTMITVWQKLRKIRSPESFKTWIYRITLNKCYDELRRSKRNPEIRADEKTWGLISEIISDERSDELENNETASIIRILTNKLSPKQKTIFIMAELENMTCDEIAAITKMNKSVIKSNLYYARKNIESLIKKYLDR